MFIREREVKGRTDVNYYTARRLGDMAESLNQLARAFDDGIEKNGQLTKDDGLARHIVIQRVCRDSIKPVMKSFF